MHLHRTTAAAGLALGGLLTLAVATPASAACDAYSGRCTEPTRVLPAAPLTKPATTQPQVLDTAATLPFTGGELVMLTAIGASALAGGTALVIAGRRRVDAR